MSETPDYFELFEVHTQKEGFIFATAAIVSCSLCGTMIDGMGGPGHGAVCNRCAKEMIAGRLRGCVIWEDKDEESRKAVEAGTNRQQVARPRRGE